MLGHTTNYTPRSKIGVLVICHKEALLEAKKKVYLYVSLHLTSEVQRLLDDLCAWIDDLVKLDIATLKPRAIGLIEAFSNFKLDELPDADREVVVESAVVRVTEVIDHAAVRASVIPPKKPKKIVYMERKRNMLVDVGTSDRTSGIL